MLFKGTPPATRKCQHENQAVILLVGIVGVGAWELCPEYIQELILSVERGKVRVGGVEGGRGGVQHRSGYCWGSVGCHRAP